MQIVCLPPIRFAYIAIRKNNRFCLVVTILAPYLCAMKKQDTHNKQTDSNIHPLSVRLKDFAAMSMEAVYVIDYLKNGFHFVADHELFLCGHNAKEVLGLGYDFYPKIIFSEDLPLFLGYYEELCGTTNFAR